MEIVIYSILGLVALVVGYIFINYVGIFVKSWLSGATVGSQL